MKCKRIVSLLLALVMCLSLVPTALGAEPVALPENFKIVVGESMTAMQEYAAKELRKYLFQLSGEDVPIMFASENPNLEKAFVLGTSDSNPLIAAVGTELAALKNQGAEAHEGEQGYVLKKVKDTLYIAGTDDEGLLYGVYGLLDDYYGIGFYFSGDAIPENKTALTMPAVNESKTPRQYMRGVLPWTNFPQSATVYSLEDWTFMIDQMTRMRMNFLNLHNYNGFPTTPTHNEMFHNFTYNDITPRNWNATARTGHGWACPGWDVNQYRFGATDLFDDYDFGTDATLHNDSLDNLEVFAKGYSEFQYIIDYAHSRGVKMGLGIDADVIMPDYGVSPAAAGIPELQTQTIVDNYPELDTLILYKAEGLGQMEDWKSVVQRTNKTLKEANSSIRLAISGWGVTKEMAAFAQSVDEDIIVAPIANYGADFEDETTYAGSEYWAGPWSEKDFDSSVYFYPFNFDLQPLIDCYQKNKDGMEGMFTLSWRLTDAVDAKISYVAKAPWDLENKYTSADAVYGEYAEKCYGSAAAADMTKLITEDEKTVIPTLWSECKGTAGFGGGDRSADVAAAQAMIDRVDTAISGTTDGGNKARLQKLRDRLICAQYYCKLDQSFNSTEWEALQADFSVWSKSFQTRIDDISSLGNVQSSQNRFVQQRYVARETALRNAQTIKAPVNVVAKGTYNGATLTWTYENNAAMGFHVYRDGSLITDEALDADARSYTDEYSGSAVYTVTAVVERPGEGVEAGLAHIEGVASIPQTCDAGSADETAPQTIVISPPTSVRAGQNMVVKARLLDGRGYDELRASIYYRALGSNDAFIVAPMAHRTKATFVASVDSTAFVDTGIEYYLSVSDGKNRGYWPLRAPDACKATCTVYGSASTAVLAAPTNMAAADGGIIWTDAEDAFWCKIYRGDDPDFETSPANYVTYVKSGTEHFADVDADFDGTPLSNKKSFYRVSTLDRAMNESAPSEAVEVSPITPDPLSIGLFMNADELANSQVATQAGSEAGAVVAFTKAGGYAKFSQMKFSPTIAVEKVDIKWATETQGNTLAVWLDGPTEEKGGTKLGEATLGGTGGWGTFKTVRISLSQAVTGTHDVYFVYGSNGSGYLYNLDTFAFTRVEAPGGVTPNPNDIRITTNDMMAFRTALSDLREDLNEVRNFGNADDRIAIGKGYRADAANASMGGATQKIGFPGYGVQCFAYFGAIGSHFGYADLPAGKAYLGYDKQGSGAGDLSVYVGTAETASAHLNPLTSGSRWDAPVTHRMRYMDTGITLQEGESIRFQNDVSNSDLANTMLNGVKLFVEQKYTVEQLDIVYSNAANTQYSVYVDGVDVATLTLQNSDGVQKTCKVPISVTNGYIELVADADDITANASAKATIFEITLRENAGESEPTVTVTATVRDGVGGQIAPAGAVAVPYGDSQTFTFTPEDGYVVESITANGVCHEGAPAACTFRNLTYDGATIEVAFALKTAIDPKFAIATQKTENGRVLSMLDMAKAGQNVTLDINPNEGYRLKAGSLQYIIAGEESEERVAISEVAARFVMPSEAVTIAAEFEKISSGGDGGSDDRTTITKKNADGSTSTIVTDKKTGTITETAQYPDGTKVVTTTTKDGATTSVVSVPKTGKKTTLNIPTAAKPGTGMVAVIVMPDGTRKVIKTSVATEAGMKITITEDATIELMDNSKRFEDVKAGDWFADSVAFVSSRELFGGTSENHFSPNVPMTRAMLMTVLYRYEGASVKGEGNGWYADSMAWAKEMELSDGTNPDGSVTREQLVTMLYRYAKPTEVGKGNMSKFTDGDKISDFAAEAMSWAVDVGLMSGKGNNSLDPQGSATRAEVATILMRFCESIAK